jgi:hypothetical protein
MFCGKQSGEPAGFAQRDGEQQRQGQARNNGAGGVRQIIGDGLEEV